MEREGEISIEDPPATFKSFVWQHFGFPVEIRNGERVTDKTNTICKHCKKTMPYTAANTSTMQKHIQNHHSSLLKPAARDENIKRANNSKCLCISSTIKCKSHGNNERHRRFHCSWYEAIFCGGKSGISATPPHTYIFILFILFIHFFMFDFWQWVTFLMWNRTVEKPVGRVYSKTFCTVCMSFTA